jgi:hypothetical protein
MPDWLSSSTTIAASGRGTVLLKQNNPARVWEVQQITVNVGPSSTSGNVSIFKNGNMVTPTSALTPAVTSTGVKTISQSAAGLPYVYIQASDELEIVVSSATSGDAITVRAQYREIDSSDPIVRGM